MRFSVVIPAFNEQAFLGCAWRRCRAGLPGPVRDHRGGQQQHRRHRGDRRRRGRHAWCAKPNAVSARPGNEARRSPAGEIIVSTDADTTLHRRMVVRHRRRPSPAIPASSRWPAPAASRSRSWWGNPYSTLLFGIGGRCDRGPPVRVIYVSATNIAFRRSACPGYDIRLTQGGDELDLLRRLRPPGGWSLSPTTPPSTSSRRLSGPALHDRRHGSSSTTSWATAEPAFRPPGPRHSAAIRAPSDPPGLGGRRPRCRDSNRRWLTHSPGDKIVRADRSQSATGVGPRRCHLSGFLGEQPLVSRRGARAASAG